MGGSRAVLGLSSGDGPRYRSESTSAAHDTNFNASSRFGDRKTHLTLVNRANYKMRIGSLLRTRDSDERSSNVFQRKQSMLAERLSPARRPYAPPKRPATPLFRRHLGSLSSLGYGSTQPLSSPNEFLQSLEISSGWRLDSFRLMTGLKDAEEHKARELGTMRTLQTRIGHTYK